MSYFAGDRAGKTIPFEVTQSDVDTAAVSSVRVVILREDGSTATWDLDALEALSPTVIQGTHILAADGSDLPIPGAYLCRAWLYDGSGNYLHDTEIEGFEVKHCPIPWPT